MIKIIEEEGYKKIRERWNGEERVVWKTHANEEGIYG